MKKFMLSVLVIILSNLLLTNTLLAQWNKVSEHFELHRAKNSKILNYSTYEEDNNLVVIDESGEINEYKMDTGELTKTCNCIKDSTFDYAQVLEDKETVVLGKKYWDYTKYGKEKFYQFELFLLNKNKCEFLTKNKIPLDSTVFHLQLDDNYGVSIDKYNLEMINVVLDNNTLVVDLNKYYKRDVDYGKPYYNERDYGEKIFFNFINNKLTYIDYKSSDKLIFNRKFDNINLKNAKIYYSSSYYNSLGVQTSSSTYNVVNYLDMKDTLKTMYSSGESSSSSHSMAGGYWSKHEGLFQDVYQVLPSNKVGFVFLRMKDSLVEFNLQTGKFDKIYKNSIFNQNLFKSSKFPYIGGIGGRYLKFYEIETQYQYDAYDFIVSSTKNEILNENQNSLYLIANDVKILKMELDRYFNNNPKLGFVVSDTVSYTNSDITLTALTTIENCQFFWYVNGNEIITNNKNQVIQFQESGIYDVKLKVLTPENKIFEYERKSLIRIKEQLAADFTYEIDKDNPLLVHFTNTSKGSFIGYDWIVPKNGWSDYRIDENYYKFEHFGDFLVTLYIFDDMKSVKITKVVNVGNNKYNVKSVSELIYNKSNILPFGHYVDIIEYNKQKNLIVERSEKHDDNDIYTRYLYRHDYQTLDSSLNIVKTKSICTLSAYQRDNLTTFLYLKDNKLIYRKASCAWDLDDYSLYIFDNLDKFNGYKFENSTIFHKVSSYEKLFFSSNNSDRIYSLTNDNASTISISKSFLDFSNFEEIKINNSSKTLNNKIFNIKDKLSFVQDSKKHFEIYLFDNELNQISYIKMDKDTNFVMSDIKLLESDNLYIYGSINYKNEFGKENYKADYGAIYKYNFDTKSLIFKEFYSRINIKQIEVINDKFLAVSGDTRSIQGYMILDDELNLEKDIRYENLSGEFRKIFLNKDTIEIYSGNLNYIKDTIDSYIMLSTKNNPDEPQNPVKTNIINIYPNPASEIAVIDLSKINPINTEINITAYDVMGNKVAHLYSGIYNSKNIEVDTRVLPIGNFMLVVSNGTQIISKQIAIMR